MDLPGSGESDKPAGPYSTEGYADQLAGFLGAIGVERTHVAGVSLGAITAPTLITFGAHDLVTSTRFAELLTSGIAASELVVFDHLSHAGLHEDPETFNRTTVAFLLRQRG